MDLLGSETNPWKVMASLINGTGSVPEAVLTGATEVTFVDGYANFSDLSISHVGNG